MKLSTVIIAAGLSAAFLSSTVADEFCNWRPRAIEDRFDIRDTTLILSSPRDTFGIYNNCVTIIRRQFGTILNFAIVNRFPADIGIQTGYALIKSIRVLSSSPLVKLSLSRGDGWYLPPAGQEKPAIGRMMNYEPYKGTIDDWNAAYATVGGPNELNQRLGIQWHAYALPDLSLASTDLQEFWKVDDGFDPQHGVITNYLIRFTVNTGHAVSPVGFKVFIQPEVLQIELHIVSNIDSLSGTYKFVVR